MQSFLRVLRSIIVNVGFISITLLSIRRGLASTEFVFFAVLTLALYNGVEIVDYKSFARAMLEATAQQDPRAEPNGGTDTEDETDER